tara:strand:+ start:611 stop:1207 length:597 start_codon:yes stop_codon:yes gene_type:complete
MRTIILPLILSLFLFSCDSDNDNINIEEEVRHHYIAKRKLGESITAKAEVMPTKLAVMRIFSYAVDTLFIKMSNYNPEPGVGIEIRCSANNTVVEIAQGVTPHVNYLKFIDLEDEWEDNYISFIRLTSPASFTSFTYSESNIDLSEHPLLFYKISGPVVIEQAPKVGTELEDKYLTEIYNVGDTIWTDPAYTVVEVID